MKKIISLLLALVMSLTLCVPAFAAEVVSSESDEMSGVQPRAATIPTSLGNLPYQATITDLSEGTGTYTLFYFAPSGTDIKISGTLNAVKDKNDTSRSAKIYLYKVGQSSAYDSYTVEQFLNTTSFTHTFINLDKNSHYYFDVRNTTKNNVSQDRWISGTMDIE